MISVFSIIILLCLISIVSQKITEYNEKAEFEKLAEIVTEKTTNTDTETETIRKPNLLKVAIQMMNFKLNSLCITQHTTNLI